MLAIGPLVTMVLVTVGPLVIGVLAGPLVTTVFVFGTLVSKRL